MEQNPSAEQFGEDAAHAPDVDLVAVVLGAHQDLRWPVILRHNLLGHAMSLVGFGYACQTKVTDLWSRGYHTTAVVDGKLGHAW